MAQHKVIFNLLNKIEIENGISINKATILNNLQLSNNQDGIPDLERKSIDISVDSEGKVGAISTKAYNVLRFAQSKFQISILGLLGASGGLISGQVVPTILGAIGIIATFLEKSQKAFNEQDAKVLLTIYRLGKLCHISTIDSNYLTFFGESISPNQLNASLNTLASFQTIEIKGEEVEIIETINIVRQ